jgi:2-methylisocitrate lyase-like PEP mutase family enzyme
VRAAAENRPDPELVLIARTDARAVRGFEEAVERANRALEAGADVAFVEAPQTLEELTEVPRRVAGPCLLNVVAAGRTPDIGLEEAAELGYALAIVPVLLLAAVMAAGDAALAGLAATGRHPDGVPVIGVEQLFRRAGASSWDDVRARYGAD